MYSRTARRSDRGRLSAKPSQQEFLRDAALDDRIHQQDVPAFQIRGRPERDFAPRVAALLNVAHVLANKMANHRCAELPDQISGENEAAIQRNDHVQAAPFVGPGDFLAQSGDPGGNSRGRIAAAAAARPLTKVFPRRSRFRLGSFHSPQIQRRLESRGPKQEPRRSSAPANRHDPSRGNALLDSASVSACERCDVPLGETYPLDASSAAPREAAGQSRSRTEPDVSSFSPLRGPVNEGEAEGAC